MRSERRKKTRFSLAFFDLIIYAVCNLVLFVFYRGAGAMTPVSIVFHTGLSLLCIAGSRAYFHIYQQIWRYGGIQCYIRLLLADFFSTVIYFVLNFACNMLFGIPRITIAKLLAFCCVDCLGALSMRMIYRYAYKCGGRDDRLGALLRWLLRVFSSGSVLTEADPDSQKIKIAIIGAGTVGVGLAEDLWANPKANYVPRCFIDSNPLKIGRDIHGIPVLSETDATLEELRQHHIQEVVFAIPNMDTSRKLELYEYYQNAGFRIKVFDYPAMNVPGQKRQLRSFNIEDLLMREQKQIITEKTRSYYDGKVILITGGGGSIGSELCRQLAKMNPKQLIVLDIYENCAYDVQQSLQFSYKGGLDVKVEIVSISNYRGLARVFAKYHPDITINAAAHKHVPLMENNCIEAVENNVFGTLDVIRCCEEFGCKRFMMVSTDKAVNPTNVMGATKRMCEMIMQAYSTRGNVVCSATRFGNVLGSAGSVIPLFKRQIAAGGPITLTDKRIIRYFMTIPEASQLVLTSGAMANNSDLFVLDMGKPVKIYDLAKNMISLSGVPCEIVETGLRPGEKLYEELLVQSKTLEKTENNMIFVEHEAPVTMEELNEKLNILKAACEADEDEIVRKALHRTVPTFHTPEEVNKYAEKVLVAAR